MRSIFTNNSSRLFSLGMIASILWLGVFGAIAMNHGGDMHMRCPIDFIRSGGCAQPIGVNFCATVHMGMLQAMSNAIPGNIDFGVGVATIISLALLLSIRARDEDVGCHTLHRVRYRDRFDKHVHSYFSQIIRWISLCEKRDSVHCLA